MQQIGLVSALVISIITDGCGLDWDPVKGPAPPVFLPNLPSARTEAAFVAEAVAAGVTAGIMQPCSRGDLICVLPLGVAFNRAGKRRLIWDGRHVNAYLREEDFRMETLQREGRALFGDAEYGGTVDISAAYHHVHMRQDAIPYLGFEWEGQFYRFLVLPFGLATAPRVFTAVMGHTVRFLRYVGIRLLPYLDDLIFAAATAREALTMGQMLLRILPRFGWIVHPTKCVGCAEPTTRFVALGTLVDLAAQQFRVPADKLEYLLGLARDVAEGPDRLPARTVARLKGLITSSWVAVGSATRVRTREMDRVIESRPQPRSFSRRDLRASWNALVDLSPACRAEIDWWLRNLCRVNGQAIRPRPFPARIDSHVFADASDTGAGAVLSVDGPEAASSSVIRALRRVAPEGVSQDELVARARRGIEYMTSFPALVRDDSSTLRELWGVLAFVTAASSLLAGGHHRVVMDNLGCVFITGGLVPPFAVGGKRFGEFVSGGSPNPSLQALAVALLDAQIDGGFLLTFEWVPREQNVRADYLSHVSAMRHHGYRLRVELFRALDERWGPHSIDRFASADNCQPLQAPHTGRFCSHYFSPNAVWTDAFTVSWEGENNWVFPPPHRLTEAVAHMRASGACGTIIAPEAPWEEWWSELGLRRGRGPDVVALRRLGHASDCLRGRPAEARRAFRDCNVIAIRMDCRRR